MTQETQEHQVQAQEDASFATHRPEVADIVIAGGGIVGLALALSIKKNLGIVPEIYEKCTTFATEAGAGLGMYANGLRVLRDIDPEIVTLVREAGYPYQKRHWERHDGTIIMASEERVLTNGELELDSVGIRRSALQTVLYNYAVKQGIHTKFRMPLANAIQIECEETGETLIEVQFADGTTRLTKMLFGADGALGKARSIVAGKDEPAIVYTGTTCLMGLASLPCEGIRFPSSNMPNFHAVFFPTAKNEMCFQFHVPTPESEANKLNWGNLSDEVGKEECRKMAIELKSHGWHDKYLEPLDHCFKAVRVGFALLEPRLKTWVKDRIVLVGDAAHPPVPYVGQGAQQGLEDTGVLVALLKTFCMNKEGKFDPYSKNFDTAMKLYQDIRIKRSSQILDISKSLGKMQCHRSGTGQAVMDTEDMLKGDILMYGTLPSMMSGADHDYKDDIKRVTEREHLPQITAEAAMEALDYLFGVDAGDTDSETETEPSETSLEPYQANEGKYELPQFEDKVPKVCEQASAMQSADVVPGSEKIASLIPVIVNVLERLLRKVIAYRNALANAKMDTSLHACADEDETFDDAISCSSSSHDRHIVVEEVKEVINLPKCRNLLEENSDAIKLSDEVLEQLRLFVKSVSWLYHTNPFHNFEHACNVTMNVYKFFQRMRDEKGNGISPVMNNSALGVLTSEPLNEFAAVFSALIHDVDHLGVPNAQLAKEYPSMASFYQGKALAEQNSIDVAWSMFMHPKYKALRSTIYKSEKELILFRQLVVNIVIATDICDKSLKDFRNQRWEKAFSAVQDSRENVNRKATIGIEHLIQACDVGHTMQPWKVYQQWNGRLYEEMYMAYKSGRAGKDPTEFWYKGEIGFFDFYIIPLAKKLKDCGIFGSVADECLENAMNNREEWAHQGEKVVDNLIKKVNKHFAEEESNTAFKHELIMI